MNELEFSYRVRALLTEGEDRLNNEQLAKLKTIRQAVLARQKQTKAAVAQSSTSLTNTSRGGATLTLGGRGGPFRLPQLSAGMAILTLVLGLVALDAYEDMMQAQELADIDTAVLTDTLPPDAYTDNGFSSFLRQSD